MNVADRVFVRAASWRAALAAALLLAAGCTSAGSTTTSTAINVSGPSPVSPPNDLKDNSARHNVALDGETFRLKVDYLTTVDALRSDHEPRYLRAGVTDSLLARWQSLGGPLPVDEAALQRAGVYAIQTSFTYRLLVRSPGDVNWHRRTVLDHLIVPMESAQPTSALPSTTTTS